MLHPFFIISYCFHIELSGVLFFILLFSGFVLISRVLPFFSSMYDQRQIVCSLGCYVAYCGVCNCIGG